MQDGISGAAHGDIQRHGIFKGRTVGYLSRQDGVIVMFVMLASKVHYRTTCLQKQLLTIRVGGEHGAVARQ